MLEFIRNHKRLTQIILLVFIIPSFIFVGVEGYKRLGDGDAVAKVAGKSITQQEWDNAQREQAERLRQRAAASGQPFDNKWIDPFVIEGLAGSGSTLAETFRLFALCIVPFLLCNGFSGYLGNGITVTQAFIAFDTDKDKGWNNENKKNDLSQTFVVAYKLKHGGLCPLRCD